MNTMTLREFIEDRGDEAVARAVGVKARTTADWRRGQRKPLPKYIPQLLEVGRGVLTTESIYCDRESRGAL